MWEYEHLQVPRSFLGKPFGTFLEKTFPIYRNEMSSLSISVDSFTSPKDGMWHISYRVC